MNQIDERTDAWSHYWQSGALHSCLGSYAGNYAGGIGAFWQRRFGDLRPDHRVLDLAAGNGPLGALMVDANGAEGMPRLDAVDLATPAPPWLGGLPETVRDRVRFHAGVRLERLPFEADEFDRVYSQFGFEYADRDAACAELLRVIKPGGGIALVCHHHGSYLANVAVEEAGHLAWLLDESGLFEATAELLPYIARTGTPEAVAELQADPAANAARHRFNDAVVGVNQRAGRVRIPDALVQVVRTLDPLMRKTASEGERAGREALSLWQDSLRASLLRSNELSAFAFDRGAADAVVARLKEAGFDARVDELHDAGYLLAWTIVADPAS